MKFTFASLLAVAAVLFVPAACISIPSIEERAALQCPEAARFGVIQISPSTVAPGGDFTVHANFTCSLSYNIIPIYIDYYVQAGPSRTRQLAPVLLARRKFHQSTNTPPTDTFSAKLPYAPWESSANYAVTMEVTYAVDGTQKGSEYLTTGGTETGIQIESPA